MTWVTADATTLTQAKYFFAEVVPYILVCTVKAQIYFSKAPS